MTFTQSHVWNYRRPNVGWSVSNSHGERITFLTGRSPVHNKHVIRVTVEFTSAGLARRSKAQTEPRS